MAAGCAVSGLAAARGAERTRAKDNRGLVVGHPEAAEAGMQILAEGGNAVDAIAAAALFAGVFAVSRCGIGGYGGHMSIALPTGAVKCIDFNTEAPQAARPDMFSLDAKGNVKGNGNVHGWLSAGVPATLAGIQLAIDRFGTLPFSQLVQPAIRCAREGFRVYWPAEPFMQRDPGSAKLYSRGGKPLVRGNHFRNPGLAAMLQQLADKGSVVDFYRGEIAQRIADAFKKNGGLVTADDMAAYQPLEVAPLTMDWRGYTIATAPLTAGGLTILQAIATIKAIGHEWDAARKDTPQRTQMWLESLRIAWGDRLRLFGDPRQVDVPVARLLSKAYAEESAEKVRQAVAQKKPVPISTDGRTATGTVHLSAVDANGMMVSMTLTHGNSFGAQVTVDELGLTLGHGVSRFAPQPGHPNSIAPRKRPLDNMSPTIVLKAGRPIAAVGAVGGRTIPNVVFQVLLKLIEEGSSLEDAVAAPRLHTEGDLLIRAEAGRPAAEVNYLKQLGYKFEKSQLGWAAGVRSNPEKKGSAVGVFDTAPRSKQEARNPNPTVVRRE